MVINNEIDNKMVMLGDKVSRPKVVNAYSKFLGDETYGEGDCRRIK